MATRATTVRLTELASCGGCAAKYSAARLARLSLGFAISDAIPFSELQNRLFA